MRYAVVVEKDTKGFGAYVPDLPGCVAAAKTRAQVVKLIHGAIEFHIEGLKQDGELVPEPSSSIEFVQGSIEHIHGRRALTARGSSPTARSTTAGLGSRP